MSFDLMSQLFGGKEGHQINSEVDAALEQVGQTVLGGVLSKFGVTSTSAGTLALVEAVLDAGVQAISSKLNLSSAEETALENLVGSVLSGSGATVPAAGVPNPPITEQPAS
jgi:hypothetical protein